MYGKATEGSDAAAKEVGKVASQDWFVLSLLAHYLTYVVDTKNQCYSLKDTVSAPLDLEGFVSLPWYVQKQSIPPFGAKIWKADPKAQEKFGTCTMWSFFKRCGMSNQHACKGKAWVADWDIRYKTPTETVRTSSEYCMRPGSGSVLQWGKCNSVLKFNGDQWVLYYDEGEGVALVVTGQPDLPTNEPGGNFCGYFRSDLQGMWVLTREQNPPSSKVAAATAKLWSDYKVHEDDMYTVNQTDCAGLKDRSVEDYNE